MAIEREKILDAALALVNEVGLDDFTTRRLAERLGVQQPALYWHFRNKSALLDALNDVMLARFHARRLPEPGEGWEEFTFANARSFRRALVSVRDGARINAGTRPTAQQFGDAEQTLALYVDAGFSPQEALNIAISVTRYVVGFVLEEQAERERTDEDPEWLDDPAAEIAMFPLLSKAIEPLIRGGAINTEAMFEGGLNYMVAGMRESLETQTKGGKRPRKR